MAAYFMGIDLGTSSVRAFVIDFDQNRTAVAGEGYDVQIPQLGYAEQDPQLWYENATAVIRRVLSESIPGRSSPSASPARCTAWWRWTKRIGR